MYHVNNGSKMQQEIDVLGLYSTYVYGHKRLPSFVSWVSFWRYPR